MPIIKILIVTCFDLFPQFDGGVIRVLSLAKSMSKFAKITVIYPTFRSNFESDAVSVTEVSNNIILNPVPIRSLTFLRLRQVCFGLIRGIPPYATGVHFIELEKAIYQVLSQQVFDIIQIEHQSTSYYYSLINKLSQAKKVLVLHNVDTYRITNAELPLTRRSLIGRLFNWLDIKMVKGWERSVVSKFDHLIVMSKQEQERLLEVYLHAKNIFIAPNGVPNLQECWEKGGETIVMVGSLYYTPNYEAAKWVVNDVMPLVWLIRPNANLIIAGAANEGFSTVELEKDPRVQVMLNVPNILDVYSRATVALVAVRAGGGTALKLLEALRLGCPIVSTSIGCRGYEIPPPCLIADSAEEMANNIIQILNNTHEQEKLSIEGKKFVESSYLWDAIALKLVSYYEGKSYETN